MPLVGSPEAASLQQKTPFQVPARLADGLGLESDRGAFHAVRPVPDQLDLVPPHPTWDLGCERWSNKKALACQFFPAWGSKNQKESGAA